MLFEHSGISFFVSVLRCLGILTIKIVPFSIVLVTFISPPVRETASFTIDKPKPVP